MGLFAGAPQLSYCTGTVGHLACRRPGSCASGWVAGTSYLTQTGKIRAGGSRAAAALARSTFWPLSSTAFLAARHGQLNHVPIAVIPESIIFISYDFRSPARRFCLLSHRPPPRTLTCASATECPTCGCLWRVSCSLRCFVGRFVGIF